MRLLATAVCVLFLGCAEEAEPAVEPPPVERSIDELSPPPSPVDPVEVSTGFVAALHAEALRVRDGRGVERDPARAAQMLERACDRGFAPSCIALSDMVEAGDGVAADADRARSLLEQACASGSTDACDRLGH